MKKSKRKKKKDNKLKSKKAKYQKFNTSREKRITQRIEEIVKLPACKDSELCIQNDIVIDDFFKKQRKLKKLQNGEN